MRLPNTGNNNWDNDDEDDDDDDEEEDDEDDDMEESDEDEPGDGADQGPEEGVDGDTLYHAAAEGDDENDGEAAADGPPIAIPDLSGIPSFAPHSTDTPPPFPKFARLRMNLTALSARYDVSSPNITVPHARSPSSLFFFFFFFLPLSFFSQFPSLR